MQHCVEDDAGGPYINPAVHLIVLGLGEAFGGHVGETASVEVLLGEEADGAGYSEVDDLDLVLFGVGE